MFASIVLAAEEELKLLPATTELVWGSLMFLALFALLSVLVFPKLKAGLAERSSKIQGQLEEAERTKQDAESLAENYKQQLAEARAESQKIVEEGRKTAEAVKAEIVAKAETEAAAIVERARAEVAGERERAIAELKGTVGTLSLDIASRVIGKELSGDEAHSSLVDQAISQIASSNGNN
ncbi:MAG: F0F1 ATP synthase subunit B [Actinomycetota bacterium]